MSSAHLSAPSSVTSSPYVPPPPTLRRACRVSTTRLLRSVLERLRPLSPRRGAPRWRDRRADWLQLPLGWTRAQVNDLVIGVPGFAPGGTTLLLVVEPVRVVASGSIDADFERAASAPGVWSQGAGATWRDAIDGWTLLLGVGQMELDCVTCAGLTAVARRNALRARFWALADSEDTLQRYHTGVVGAVMSVHRFVEGKARIDAE